MVKFVFLSLLFFTRKINFNSFLIFTNFDLYEAPVRANTRLPSLIPTWRQRDYITHSLSKTYIDSAAFETAQRISGTRAIIPWDQGKHYIA